MKMLETFFKVNRTKHMAGKNIPEMIFTVVDIDQVTETSVHNLEDLGTPGYLDKIITL